MSTTEMLVPVRNWVAMGHTITPDWQAWTSADYVLIHPHTGEPQQMQVRQWEEERTGGFRIRLIDASWP